MTKTNTLSSVRKVARGFTLLEVLIAMLVLSIGLLGIGKLMMLSARANDSAYMRTQATALAYTVLDAMRSNRQAALSQAYDTAMGVFPGPPAPPCAVATPCNAGQQAQNDLNLWGNSLAAQLPLGQGSIATANALNAGGATTVTATITVQWSDKVAEQSFGAPAGNLMSITLETVL